MPPTVLMPPRPRGGSDVRFFGHPSGLGWLAFCEFWERFSFYGMQGLLGLYLTKYLFMPERAAHVAGIDAVRRGLESMTGPSSNFEFASEIVGLYGGLVYLTPILGGVVADRWLGRSRAVIVGAALMAVGHFFMAIESAFFVALACLLVGVGLFKGNIAAQVGALYEPGDKRNASAFQIFVLAVQIAVIAAPLVCGSLGETVAWHWGFDAAGVGMLLGLLTYVLGRKSIEHAPRSISKREGVRRSMSMREWARLGLLVGLLPILLLTTIGNLQFGTGFPLWADMHMDLVVSGWRMPTTWIQGVDALVSLLTMLLSIAFWRAWSRRRREPDELTKMGVGTLIGAAGPALMMLASGVVDESHQRVGLGWMVAYSFANNVAFANILPVGMALYTRVAPRQVVGLVIGIYYVHLAAGSIYVGWIAGSMEKLSSREFWSLNAGLVAAGGVLLLVVRLLFWRFISPAAIESTDAASTSSMPTE